MIILHLHFMYWRMKCNKNVRARQVGMQTSRKTDFRKKNETSAGLKITLVDMTYPGQRRHFLLVEYMYFEQANLRLGDATLTFIQLLLHRVCQSENSILQDFETIIAAF